jgi:hypothetical protein
VFVQLFSTYIDEGLGSLSFVKFYEAICTAIPNKLDGEKMFSDINNAMQHPNKYGSSLGCDGVLWFRERGREGGGGGLFRCPLWDLFRCHH